MKEARKDKQRLRIVGLTPHLFVGGAERLMIDIFSRLDQDKFELYWCCLKAGSAEAQAWQAELLQAGVKIKVLDQRPRHSSCLVRLWRAIVIAVKLWFYLYRIKPDILQTQLAADIYQPIGCLAGVPTVISVEHNIDNDEPKLNGWLKKIFRYFSKYHIAVSEAVKLDVVKRYGYPAEQVEVIYNGIDLKKFKSAKTDKKWPANHDHWRLGAIGRLTPQKGFDLLIQALARLPKEIGWKCSIAGEGRQRSGLEDLVKYLNVSERVELVGHQADVPGFLSGLDLLIVPSRWEGLGLVVLEAGAAGLPVLASAVDGIKEIINDRVDGYLVTAGSPEQLADGLTDVMTGDSQRLAEWSANLQARVEHDFSIDQTVESYQKLYQQLSKR